MLPENIDDLFRDKLAGHATPPGDALWARLQAGPAAETPAETPATAPDPAARLDQLFRQRLDDHATPPRRELWERLEDEHLRPRKRRAAAWWPLALVAAVALLLVAGGASLWLGRPWGNSRGGTLATQRPALRPVRGGSSTEGPAPVRTNRPTSAAAPTAPAELAANTPAAQAAASPMSANPTVAARAIEKKQPGRATRATGLASTASKARISGAELSSRHPTGAHRQPDAAAAPAPLLARTPARPAAADEQRAAPLVAAATQPSTFSAPAAPAPEIFPAGAVPAPGLAAATTSIISVDVRRGAAPRRASLAGVVASAEASAEGRGLGGRLLRQAGHLVRGERVSLAEVTGLPENLTLQATIAGRRVSKSIQL